MVTVGDWYYNGMNQTLELNWGGFLGEFSKYIFVSINISYRSVFVEYFGTFNIMGFSNLARSTVESIDFNKEDSLLLLL